MRDPEPAGEWAGGGLRLILVAFSIMAVSSGVWHAFAVYFVALLEAFGRDRGWTAGIFSVYVVMYGLLGVPAGRLVDRIGARRVIVLGAAAVLVGLIGDGLVGAPWQFYLTHGLFVAVGSAFVGWIPLSTFVPRWFRRHLGLAVGIMSAGSGLGIMVMVPLVERLIALLGWRAAFAIQGGLSFALVMPLAVWGLARVDVGRGGAPATGAAGGAAREPGGAGVATLGEAARSKAFWLLGAAFFLTSITITMVTVHQVALLVDRGVSRALAASAAGVLGLVSIGAKIGWGWLADRWGREVTLSAGTAFMGAGILGLLAAPMPAGPPLLIAIVSAVSLGYAVVPTLTPLLTADFFRGRSLGVIFGVLNMLHMLGGAVGAWFGGWAHDATGDYRVPFALAFAVDLVGVWCVWIAAPRRLV
jgi:MFS family permease